MIVQRRACDEHELKDALADVEYLCTALRRIRSLEEKNVPKYAQQIAREALAKLPDQRPWPMRGRP
jgi:Xaa-Pro aminopeptidase